MYCRSHLADPFTKLKHFSRLVPLKFFRLGPVRFGILQKIQVKPVRVCCTDTFNLNSVAKSRILHCKSESSVEQGRFSVNQICLSKRLDSGSIQSCDESRSAMGVADEAGVARRFWMKFRKESVLAMYNPFVVALAAGTLNIESFRHYIAQDAYFLKAFVQAYTMAEDCADDDDDKSSICNLRKGIEEELNLHNALAEDWGVEFAKECSPNMATVKYTEFLLATAAGKVEGGRGPSRSVTPFEKTKIAAYAVGAMTPCMRLYAFLGKEIFKVLESECSNHPYKEWIETYSSANFEESALQTEELLDRLAISLTGEELEVLGRLYHHALKLEIEFFSAQTFFTEMSVDSSAVLAEIAILTTLKAEQNGVENVSGRKLSSDLRNTWDALSSQYYEEYEQCLRKILPSEEVGTFDYEGLCRSLEQLSQFEAESNSKVVESAVLQGLNIEDVKKAGERLVLQDGCANFFQQILSQKDNSNVEMHIVSVCWSGDIIRASFSSSGLDGINIHSNELNYVESVSTGEIDRRVESPVDKSKVFNDILSCAKENGTEHLSIYMGDSVGDLLCLLQADIGIVIGTSSNLRRIGKHFGVSFVPLFSGLLKKERAYAEGSASWTGLGGILYTVSSWTEIHAFLLGFSN